MRRGQMGCRRARRNCFRPREIMHLRRGEAVPRHTRPSTLVRFFSGLTAMHTALCYCLVRIGRLDDAIQLLTQPPGSGLIPGADEPWYRWSHFVVRVEALVYAGRLSEAEELLTLANDQVVDQPAAE